jgi:hypothetical protein
MAYFTRYSGGAWLLSLARFDNDGLSHARVRRAQFNQILVFGFPALGASGWS